MDIKIILRALGEPMRYTIYFCLLQRKHCTRSLSKKLGISESAISQHMKILREAGLVYGEKHGYHTHYLPTQEAADFLSETVKQIQQLSRQVDRDTKACQCEFRKEKENEKAD